ncbi:hypothetical protein KKD52_10035 [Myxococcota bacterium]|nr:hypothetical protein [Myxococcota bacterium]MBU1410487.1 hypothetical protein [Myxococcota bacterium]MBU1510687.1 hypothetical protein [Myxococcota bacterium]
MFFKAKEGSTTALIQLCIGYFIFYVITGVSVKYFLNGAPGFPAMEGMEFLVYSTAGGMGISMLVVMILKWYRFESPNRAKLGPFDVPAEFLYIIPSGICTAVVVPTTTLLYSFDGISVMVAMVLMRGSVIVISRFVDELQIRQGILKRTVYMEENIAVIIAIATVALGILSPAKGGASPFSSVPVMVIFISYICAYALRIYIMNYYKNTRPKGATGSNNGFFAIEQITATTTVGLVTLVLLVLYTAGVVSGPRSTCVAESILSPTPGWWYWALLAGAAYGVVAFFSVFIFMFKGRTATFAGLVNRLTSLVAGTIATLLFAVMFGGKYPHYMDWVGLALILVAVAFMTKAEKRRARELAQEELG